MADMGVKRDVPIVLNSISYEDSYRGDYAERRAIIYTLAFTAKFYHMGLSLLQKLSRLYKLINMQIYKTKHRKRENKDIQSPLTQSLLTADDDFGFNETVSFFQDAKDRDLTTGTDKTSTND